MHTEGRIDLEWAIRNATSGPWKALSASKRVIASCPEASVGPV